jgi:hypothetical protein
MKGTNSYTEWVYVFDQWKKTSGNGVRKECFLVNISLIWTEYTVVFLLDKSFNEN